MAVGSITVFFSRSFEFLLCWEWGKVRTGNDHDDDDGGDGDYSTVMRST